MIQQVAPVSRALGQETPGAQPQAASAFAPLIDKIGVPLLWFGLGYLAATLMQKPRRAA